LFAKVGGWEDKELIPYFVDYARFLFQNFGDRVKTWVTFNEPFIFCVYGYELGDDAPGLKHTADGAYKCAHTVLKSHGLTYRIYEKEFKPKQKGQIGISIYGCMSIPASDSAADIEAAERLYQFQVSALTWLRLKIICMILARLVC